MGASAGDVLGRLQDVFAHDPLRDRPAALSDGAAITCFGGSMKGDEQG